MCVFSTHSVVKDPPFSKLDLLSCRNLLIYVDADLQDRVLRTFHYALNPDGVLFLGPAEGVTRQSKIFGTLDKKHRIFQRLAANISLPELSSSAASAALRHPLPALALRDTDQIGRSAKRVADKYSPVYLVIDDRHEIVRFSGGEAGRYLEPTAGPASFKLFDILRKSLRPVVRSALQAALASKEAVVQDDVPLRVDGQVQAVTVVIEPIVERGVNTGLYVLVLQSSRKHRNRHDAEADVNGDDLRAMGTNLGRRGHSSNRQSMIWRRPTRK